MRIVQEIGGQRVFVPWNGAVGVGGGQCVPQLREIIDVFTGSALSSSDDATGVDYLIFFLNASID